MEEKMETENEMEMKTELAIVRLERRDVRSLTALYRTVAKELGRQGIGQWDRFYPNRFVIGADVKRRAAFGIRDGGRVIAAVVVDCRQSGRYGGLPWSDASGRPLCIHRLAVHPERQGRGIGTRLLAYAEQQASHEGATSIRLDVFAGNPGAVAMYRRFGYAGVGSIRYPMRAIPYLCMEKRLDRALRM